MSSDEPSVQSLLLSRMKAAAKGYRHVNGIKKMGTFFLVHWMA